MNFAPALPRSPVSPKAVGLLFAALALGTGSSIATVATASHQSLPVVTSHAPAQAPATTDTQASTDSTTSTTTTTNNANSNAFGQQVVQQVKTCKAQAAAAGTHGIGSCVSTWVVQNNPGSTHRHTH